MSARLAAVSINTAAEMYDVSRDTIRFAVNSGALRSKRLPGRPGKDGTPTPGKAIRIDVTDLSEWFANLEDVAS